MKTIGELTIGDTAWIRESSALRDGDDLYLDSRLEVDEGGGAFSIKVIRSRDGFYIQKEALERLIVNATPVRSFRYLLPLFAHPANLSEMVAGDLGWINEDLSNYVLIIDNTGHLYIGADVYVTLQSHTWRKLAVRRKHGALQVSLLDYLRMRKHAAHHYHAGKGNIKVTWTLF